MPKYIWRAIAYLNDDEKLFELLFDTTDISSSNILFCIINYSSEVKPITDLLNNNYHQDQTKT